MSPDIQKYRRHLDGHAISEDDKEEMIRALWLIMESFVDRAFDPTSNRAVAAPKDATSRSLMIEFEQTSKHHYGLADRSIAAPDNGIAKGGSK